MSDYKFKLLVQHDKWPMPFYIDLSVIYSSMKEILAGNRDAETTMKEMLWYAFIELMAHAEDNEYE